MKQLLLAALLFLAFTVQAQRKPRPQPAPTLTVPIMYCELERREDYRIYSFSLNYGQAAPTYVQDSSLAEAEAYIANFTSVAAALNYLYSRGWECLSTSTVSYDVDKLGTVSNRVRYLLRRRTP